MPMDGYRNMYTSSAKKSRLHSDAPRAPCASGGPGAYNVNWRPGCAVYWGVLVNRGPCRPAAPDATQDSEVPDAERFSRRNQIG